MARRKDQGLSGNGGQFAAVAKPHPAGRLGRVPARNLQPGQKVTDGDLVLEIRSVDVRGMFTYITLSNGARLPVPSDRAFPLPLA